MWTNCSQNYIMCCTISKQMTSFWTSSCGTGGGQMGGQSGLQGLPVRTEPLNLYNRFGSMGRLAPYFWDKFLKIFCTHMRWSDS